MPDFSYYKPINQKQADFHKSKAMNKLLMGGFRAGKTYPAIHEACFICNDNPGHEFAIFRNTEKSLERNVQKDFIKIAQKAGALKESYKKSTKQCVWWNGLIVHFLPLSISIAQLKGMNLCGFYIDDPNVAKYKKTIAFLFTRLTDPANGAKAAYFSSIITANYEGHDWLWQKYMRRKKPGGDGMFAYWLMETTENTTLPPDYIKLQEATHSESWMKRYIKGDQKSYVGLVYDEYDPEIHDKDLSWCFDDNSLLKILVVDLGITHPAVVLQAATDFTNIYFYNEWFKTNMRTNDVGEYLTLLLDSKENIRATIIDPKSCAREQTSGTSPMSILRKDFGIKNIKLADNSMRTGIELQKGLMKIRDIKDAETGEIKKVTHFFIDPIRCPNLARELETLKWKEPESSDFDELSYTEEPVDVDNDATDCSRYGGMYLKKFMTGLRIALRQNDTKKINHWNDRFNKLKIYQKNPEVVSSQRDQLTRAMRNNKTLIMRDFYNKRILTSGRSHEHQRTQL